MDPQLDRLEGKLDKLDERLDSIDKILAVYAEQLTYHIKRTDLGDENLKLLRQEIKPIHKHVVMVEGVLKFIGLLSLVGSLAVTIIKLFGE